MRAGLVVVAVTVLFTLSGCFGGNSPDGGATTPGPSTSTPGPSNTVGGNDTIDGKPVFNPHHQHNLWNGREKITLFDQFPVILGEDAQKETEIYQDPSSTDVMVVYVGYKEFDTSMDGAAAQGTVYSDVVLQGASKVTFKVEWSTVDSQDNHMPGLSFFYKAANTVSYEAKENIENGKEYDIKIEKGMSDMAHSATLSRWEFALRAYDAGAVDTGPVQFMVAKGTAKVTMHAYYGGHDSIDAPHPFYFLDRTSRYAGNWTKSLDIQSVDATQGTNDALQYSSKELTGWTTQDQDVIPWDSSKLKAWLHYNYTGPATQADHKLDLLYTDASGRTLKVAEAKTTTAYSGTFGYVHYYEWDLRGQNAKYTDDPYARTTGWTWGIKPVVADDTEHGGDFKGIVKLSLIVEGDDTTVVQP